MRVKHVWNYVPLPAMLKLVWDRLTFNRITTAYFIFSLVHCILQLGLQIRAFTINASAAAQLYDLSVQANATNNSVPVFEGDELELCDDVTSTATCVIVWEGKNGSKLSTEFSQQTSGSSAFDEYLESSSSATVSVTSSVSLSPVVSPSSSAAVASTVVRPPTSVVTTIVVVTPAVSTTASRTTTSALSVSTVPGQNTAVTRPVDNDEDDDEDEDDHSDSDSEFGEDDDEDDDEFERRGLKITAKVIDDGMTQQVTVTGDGLNNVTLSKSCLWALNWPVSTLENTKREDVVFIAFQIWVLGMSFVALMNESIPHVIASLLTHILATIWSGFQISHTANFRSSFNHVIVNGACGVPLLGGYWNNRANAEYATLALNIIALFVSGFLSWKLFKSFGWLTFKRVGASLTINRIYKLVLVLSIALQLSLFFMGATVGLWIDSLFNGVGAQHGEFITFYRATSFVTFLLLVPWVVAGWIGVRSERRIPTFIFLVLSILYLAAWSTMFFSDTFRWMYLHWVFFCLMATASVFLTLVTFVLGLVCRYNFGKGLPRYLQAQELLPGDDFTPVTNASDIEKVAFPTEAPLPTFSAAFGKEVPPPTQMFPSRVGPRFYRASSSEPFETPRNSSPVTVPSVAMTRPSSPSSDDPYPREPMMGRSNSRASDKSFGSLASYYSYGSDHTRVNSSESHRSNMHGKRWVIE